MDINSLLSPQDSPVSEPTTSKSLSGPPKTTHSSSITPNPTSSPHAQPSLLPPSLSYTAVSQAQQAVRSPPIISPSSGQAHSVKSTPPADAQPGSNRQGSTPGMDTLADLASMQHHQQTARANAGGLRASEVYDSPQIPQNAGYASLAALPHSKASTRSSVDVAMADTTPDLPPPRTFTTTSLSESDLQNIAHLVSYVSDNPYSFDSHQQLLTLLHQGYENHCLQMPAHGEAQDYELFQDLRQAREAMAARFPMGEDLWAEWIADEKRACKTAEECVVVMELYQKAIGEECGSTRLWLDYGEWMWSLYDRSYKGGLASRSPEEGSVQHPWTEEDKILGREIFGWDTMLDIWKQAVRETSMRMNDSHLIWDRYMEIILAELETTPSLQKIGHAKDLFVERLQTPHATWDQTFQAFSTFVTKYDNASYEQTMVNATKRSADGRSQYELREVFEIKIQRSVEVGDKAAERNEFQVYLDWEFGQVGKKKGGVAFCKALFDRAVLRFPTDAFLWEDYVFFVLDRVPSGPNAISTLSVLDRATRHCPWSGTLWSQFLLSSEKEGKSFQEIEDVKHSATKRGLMDIGGMEEVLKVHTAWCGYLNRRAFQEKATDEEADVAEVGILSALESVKELGQKKYGSDYEGDHQYRLERIYIEYLSRSKLWDRARAEVWQPLAKTRGDSYEFWVRWYHWEMFQWAHQMGGLHPHGLGDQPSLRPSAATSLLRKAIGRRNMDWPEKILEVFLHHVEHHESVEELQHAMILIRKSSKWVVARREREAQEAREAALLLQEQQQDQEKERELDVIPSHSVDDSTNGIKRKRDSETDAFDTNTKKKSRPDDRNSQHPPDAQHPPSAASLIRRDRENGTVTVKNLPPSTTETKVRQYFRDCGTINSLKVLPDDSGGSLTATIEFEGKEDVLAAQTRDMKTFEGNTIEVQVGTGATLYVTNFPPTADEAYIRDLFSEFGDPIDVRFPSLKYNTHRRFCYVQFQTSGQAHRGLALHGKALGDKEKLVVKISEPSNKQARTGPIYEGREVYVSNVDWTATEDELRAIFSKYGQVESVRIPTNVGGKSKGIAFVVFALKIQDEATAALELDLTKFKTRILYVSLSVANPTKRQATSVSSNVKPESSSNSPAPQDNQEVNGSKASKTPDPPPPNSNLARPKKEAIRSRTIALLNVPDTVNDARIRALMEPFGMLTKVVLRPDHQGAIVEFNDINSAGKASLGIEGHEIAPGRKIQVGDVKDMLDQKAEFKSDRITVGKKKGEEVAASKPGLGLHQSGHIHRPPQPGGRRGGRGGLGTKRGGVGLGGSRARDGAVAKKVEPISEPNTAAESSEEKGHEGRGDDGSNARAEAQEPPHDQSVANNASEGPGVKSNADFRAMFLN
ncbi:MAG: Splicing factor [Sclerophora amabilis]|nr:MAG: Splicing factor [Sclerophora amabilis]